MATFYYYTGEEYDPEVPPPDWHDLAYWFTNANHTTPALTLPADTDDVVVSGYTGPNTNASGPVTVANITVHSFLGIDITVTGMATFEGSAQSGYYTVLTGDATFNGTSSNFANIAGSVTFNDSSELRFGSITGNATFNHTSANYEGIDIAGTCTLNDYAVFGASGWTYVYGTSVCNDYSQFRLGNAGSGPTFNDNSQYGGPTGIPYAQGVATFNQQSYCAGECYCDGFEFNDDSYAAGALCGMYAACVINGKPVVFLSGFNNPYSSSTDVFLNFRRRSGINGSSILGVI